MTGICWVILVWLMFFSRISPDLAYPAYHLYFALATVLLLVVTAVNAVLARHTHVYPYQFVASGLALAAISIAFGGLLVLGERLL